MEEFFGTARIDNAVLAVGRIHVFPRRGAEEAVSELRAYVDDGKSLFAALDEASVLWGYFYTINSLPEERVLATFWFSHGMGYQYGTMVPFCREGGIVHEAAIEAVSAAKALDQQTVLDVTALVNDISMRITAGHSLADAVDETFVESLIWECRRNPSAPGAMAVLRSRDAFWLSYNESFASADD